MSSKQYHLYTIRDRKTNEVLFQGGRGKCAEFLGCPGVTVWKLANRCWATGQGYFNSRYIVTSEAHEKPVLKHFKVYEDGKLVVEGSSWDCAKALNVKHDLWPQFVYSCDTQKYPKYTIESDWI